MGALSPTNLPAQAWSTRRFHHRGVALWAPVTAIAYPLLRVRLIPSQIPLRFTISHQPSKNTICTQNLGRLLTGQAKLAGG